MKHVQESLSQYYDYKFFKVFEEDEKEEKTSLQDKEKDGLAVVEKAKKNFEDFKKAAKGDIKKWKEFWEENKLAKEAFDEEGGIYQMYDSDYVIGVLELPATTLSDGSLDGGFGADDTEPEAEEEIIEGPVMEADENDPTDDLNFDEDPATQAQGQDLNAQPGGQDLNVDAPQQNPGEVPPVEDPTASEPPMNDQPIENPAGKQTPDLDAPQVYFVVYDNKGEGREEIFRCGSNNVVKAFNAFYNDTFKGSMKDMIIQYKAQKEALKKEAEKGKKEKVEKEKESKIKKFLGGGGSKPTEEKEEKPEKKATNEGYLENRDLDYDIRGDWNNEVYTYLTTDYEMANEDAETFMDSIVDDELDQLFDEGMDASDAAATVAANEEALEKLYDDQKVNEEFGAIDREDEDWSDKTTRKFPNEQDDDYDEDRELSNFKHSLNVMLEDEANPLGVDEEIIYSLTALINGGDIDDTIERLFNLDTDPLEALEYLMNDKAVCDELGISCEEDSFDEGKFVTEGASQTYEGVNEDYDPDLDDEEDEEDYENGEDYEQEMSTDNPASDELLNELDELEHEIWESDNQSIKDKWEEISQNHLAGASYWGDIDSWNVERAIEDAMNLIKRI